VQHGDRHGQVAWQTGIAFEHLRIVARHEVADRSRQLQEALVPGQHLFHIHHHWKRQLQRRVVVVMRGVRGQHYPPARRMHPHRLQPFGMAADAQQFDAGLQHVVAIVELDAVFVQPVHELADILDRERASCR